MSPVLATFTNHGGVALISISALISLTLVFRVGRATDNERSDR